MSPSNYLSNYHFQVQWGGTRISFCEVSGLNISIEPLTYRSGDSRDFFHIKKGGIIKYSDITLKRAIQKGDNDFYEWISTIEFDDIQKRDVIIELLNEAFEPVVIWKLKNCFPIKYIGPVLRGECGDIAMETLVLTCESMAILNE